MKRYPIVHAGYCEFHKKPVSIVQDTITQYKWCEAMGSNGLYSLIEAVKCRASWIIEYNYRRYL